jgi:hypothetical protein
MTVVKGIGDGFDDLDDLILILASVVIFWFTKFSALHVFHDYVEKIGVVINFIDLNDIWVLKSKQNFALVQKRSKIRLTDPVLVDNLNGILTEVLPKNCLSNFSKGTLAQQLLKDIVLLNGIVRYKV